MTEPPCLEILAKAETGGLPARRAAFQLLAAVAMRNQALDDALEKTPALSEIAEARDRAFARALALTVLRRQGQLDQLIDRYLAREPKGKAQSVRLVLRLGAAQLIFLGTPPHAAVATSVDLAEAETLAAFKGLINAILRKIAKDGADVARKQEAGRLNTPAWLRESWESAYGQAAARAIGEAHLAEPPLDLTLKPEEDAALWADRLSGTALEPQTVRLPATGDVRRLAGFDEGRWWVQDAAAALPARLLEAAAGGLSGKDVIDLCAAPGGKTAQLCAAGARVTAVDRSKPRLARLTENLQRLDLSAEVIAADAETWRPEAPVDAVLLDAPCSATGTLRRHPDIAQLKGPADVARLAALQRRLIVAALAMLKPGGLLLYATCSLQPEEGERAIAELLDGALDGAGPCAMLPIEAAWLGGFVEARTPSGGLRTLPYMRGEAGGCDGFYAALIQKPAG
ncbi:MAG: transcription antitermination factor NusB [Marivibrio sp.]|uniref:RsmB/NOP family class I SAM-dependent RNA methyltransferase n=1 Tax=Marivibrio sp. TaxID=2039719 RepID=UPI0032ECDD07